MTDTFCDKCNILMDYYKPSTGIPGTSRYVVYLKCSNCKIKIRMVKSL
jgi:RNase P subunit RPR2